MATTFDRTIEQFDLIDRFSNKLEQMSKHTDRFARKVDAAQKVVMRFSIGIAGALGAGLIKLAVDAVEAASQFEMFRVTLEVLTGSAEKAEQKLDFMRRLAIPSTFTFQQLAEAGTQLESFRVPLEKALPSIAKLGAAFPNKEIGDFVNLFGRLASGDFPDLEALSGAGLSKLDFMRKGIKFDAQGSLLSSSRKTMDALESIINDRYGTILDKVANTTASKLATARDKWEQNLRKIGDAIIKYLNPALDKLSVFLDKLDKDRSFDKFLKNLGDNFVRFVVMVFKVFAALMAVVALLKFAFRDVVGGILATVGALAAIAGGAYFGTKLKGMFKGLEAGNGASAPVEVPTAPPGMEFPDNPALKTLNAIEKHTKDTSDNTKQTLDFRKYALGGGDIAAMGISPIDRYGRQAGGGRANTPIQVEGRDSLARAMQEIAQQVYEQMTVKMRLNGMLR